MVAKDNAIALKLQSFTNFVNADVVNSIDNEVVSVHPQNSRVIIVSNPPYIPQKRYDILSKSVKDYEPALALIRNEAFYDKLSQFVTMLRNSSKIVSVYIEDSDENSVPYITGPDFPQQ